MAGIARIISQTQAITHEPTRKNIENRIPTGVYKFKIGEKRRRYL